MAFPLLGGGLEPPRLSAYAPQTYVSAIPPPERLRFRMRPIFKQTARLRKLLLLWLVLVLVIESKSNTKAIREIHPIRV